MGQKKQQSGMKAEEHGKHRSGGDNQNIGGREFGQVIEPMQAEMASENDGLTENSTGKPRENQKKMPGKRRKAA
jgi:hypothetical protein